MSFSFYVPVPEAPSLELIEDLVDDPRWTCTGDGELAEGAVRHPYLQGVAARGVELSYDAGEIGVRIMTCSTAADHELALAIVHAVAGLHGASVRPEADDPMTLAALADAYGPAWIAQQVAWGPDAIVAMIDREPKTLTMSGVRRPFHLGPRFLATLRERGGDLGTHVLDAFVALQNVDEDAYYEAKTMEIKPKTGGDGYTIAVWAQTVAYLFSEVDRLAILADAAPIEVPYVRGIELAGSAWTWLDEQHATVEAISETAWPELVRRAHAFVVH